MASRKKKVAPVEVEIPLGETIETSMVSDIIANPLWETEPELAVEAEPELAQKEEPKLVLLEKQDDGTMKKIATAESVIIPASGRLIDTIICHCDDSDVDGYDDIEEVRKDHTRPISEGGRGFSDIAYHFYIKSDGTVQKGRPLNVVGAHAKNYNEHSIGICVHGRKLFTAASLQSLEDLIRSLIGQVPTIKKVIGHCEVDFHKTCPNYNMKRFKMIPNEF